MSRTLYPRSAEDLRAEYVKRRKEVLQRSLELSQARVARNCVHHHQQDGVGFCLWGSPYSPAAPEDADQALWAGDLCEGEQRAFSCAYFVPKLKPLQVLEKTVVLLNDPDFLKEAYPDLAVLGWALGMEECGQDLTWWLRRKARLREAWASFRGRVWLAEQDLQVLPPLPLSLPLLTSSLREDPAAGDQDTEEEES